MYQTSFLLCAKSYANEQNVNNDVSMNPPIEVGGLASLWEGMVMK